MFYCATPQESVLLDPGRRAASGHLLRSPVVVEKFALFKRQPTQTIWSECVCVCVQVKRAPRSGRLAYDDDDDDEDARRSSHTSLVNLIAHIAPGLQVVSRSLAWASAHDSWHNSRQPIDGPLSAID